MHRMVSVEHIIHNLSISNAPNGVGETWLVFLCEMFPRGGQGK